MRPAVARPPTATAIVSAAGTSGERAERDQSVNALMREGFQAFEQYGVTISVSKLRRLINRWLDSAECEQEFGTWVITYADPTGETAVRHVMGPTSCRVDSEGRRRG